MRKYIVKTNDGTTIGVEIDNNGNNIVASSGALVFRDDKTTIAFAAGVWTMSYFWPEYYDWPTIDGKQIMVHSASHVYNEWNGGK